MGSDPPLIKQEMLFAQQKLLISKRALDNKFSALGEHAILLLFFFFLTFKNWSCLGLKKKNQMKIQNFIKVYGVCV